MAVILAHACPRERSVCVLGGGGGYSAPTARQPPRKEHRTRVYAGILVCIAGVRVVFDDVCMVCMYVCIPCVWCICVYVCRWVLMSG